MQNDESFVDFHIPKIWQMLKHFNFRCHFIQQKPPISKSLFARWKKYTNQLLMEKFHEG